MPTIFAVMGSSEVVSVSKQTKAAWLILLSQRSKSASLNIVAYLRDVTGVKSTLVSVGVKVIDSLVGANKSSLFVGMMSGVVLIGSPPIVSSSRRQDLKSKCSNNSASLFLSMARGARSLRDS